MNIDSKCPKLPWMIDFHTSDDGQVFNNQYKSAFAPTHLEYLSTLNIKSRPSLYRSTKLVCNAPTNVTANAIEDVLKQGISIVVITANKYSKVRDTLSKVRVITDGFAYKIGRIYPLGIAFEIKGPEIRTGLLKDPNKKILLEKSETVNLTTEKVYEEFVDQNMIFVDYEKLVDVIQPGDKVLLDNGLVTLSAIQCVESIIKCIVEKTGQLGSHASVIIPNAPIELPLISAEDKELIEIAIGERIDFLFISGVHSLDGVSEVKSLLGPDGQMIQIIIKIESTTAVENIDELIKVADGICIDCEKLLLTLPKEKLFLAQRSIIAKCNMAGVPVMSTIQVAYTSGPSKTESSDIVSTILTGSDGLLLPPEAFSFEVLKSINILCKEAEPAMYQKQIFSELIYNFQSPMEAIYSLAISAIEASYQSNAAAIICLTSSGRTARILSRFRPRCPVLSITRYYRVARQLSLYRSIEPLIYLNVFCGNWNQDVDKRIQYGVTYGKYMGYIRMGDALVTITPSRPEVGMSNTVRVVYASDFDALPMTKI